MIAAKIAAGSSVAAMTSSLPPDPQPSLKVEHVLEQARPSHACALIARMRASVVTRPYKDYIRSSIFKPRSEMKLSTQVRPITYLKANAAEVIRDLAEHRQTLVITQNGEAKAVMQDVASYEQTQETLALLKILALGNRQIEQGKVVAAADVIGKLRRKRERKKPRG